LLPPFTWLVLQDHLQSLVIVIVTSKLLKAPLESQA